MSLTRDLEYLRESMPEGTQVVLDRLLSQGRLVEVGFMGSWCTLQVFEAHWQDLREEGADLLGFGQRELRWDGYRHVYWTQPVPSPLTADTVRRMFAAVDLAREMEGEQ